MHDDSAPDIPPESSDNRRRGLADMLNLIKELSALIREFDAQRVPYALCGGLAMAVWGKPRATVDIDVLLATDDLARAREAAHRCGYTLDAAPMTFSKGRVEIRRVTKLDPETKEPLWLDLLLTTPSTLGAWQGRQKLKWEAGDIWVVSRDGLVALKKLRNSAQDKADIEALNAKHD